MKKNNGGSAFPQHTCENCEDPITGSFKGMTLRDYFAGQALSAMDCNDINAEIAAEEAYYLSDAMLAERKKNQ